MIQFQYPELFLLIIPLGMLFRRWGQVRGVTGWLRGAFLLLMVTALTSPQLNLSGRGLDVIVVADRSRSLSAEAHHNIRELVTNMQNYVSTRAGDRLSLVTFGSEARVEFELSDQNRITDYAREINPDGSDLYDAIMTALDRVNVNRPARLLLLTDGESNGRDPTSAARRAREMQVPVDARMFERLKVGDAAVESVQLPESVVPLEPFQFSVWVHSDREIKGTVRVSRQGKVIAEQQRDLTRGMNRLLFRDVLDEPGMANYSVELLAGGDPVAENNVGAGVVRIESGPRVLVLNLDGTQSNLTRALQAASIPVDTAKAIEHPLRQDSLERYRAVVLENVPADQLGRLKMERLAQFVEDLGGGLLVTGGKRSFGVGGYFKSPLDDVLPVSMELREEHRKTRAAIVIALDRSGSMTATVPGGKQKMDLANLGTAECIKMLSPQDMVAVFAVDEKPHVIQPLSNVDDPLTIANKVLRIRSEGGGIFVYEALVAAGRELLKADGYSTRHIILFSDAADSEEPGAYEPLLSKYAASQITVSVIGLGTKSDPDAKLLEDIAKRGNGNMMFTNDAQELPRLFTQDTMSIARNTFITKEDSDPKGIASVVMPDARLIGELGFTSFPLIDGYNLSYLKSEATAAIITRDEYNAPISAAWHRGLGRVVALTLEVDGPHTGALQKWDRYEDFLITHLRWLVGSKNPEQVFVKIDSSGQEAVMSVELDPDRKHQDDALPPKVLVVPPGDERQQVLEPNLIWTGPHTLEARFRMDRLGTYRTLVKTSAQEFTRGPAVALPYSPEFAPRVGLPEGSETLTEITKLSGGKLRTDVLELFRDPPRSARTMPLLAPLMIAGIVTLLLEIAGRRLSLWERLREVASPPEVAALEAQRAAAQRAINAAKPQPSWKRWFQRRPRTVASVSAEPANNAPTSKPESSESAPTPPAEADAASVFAKAKDRARRRS